MSKKLTLKVTRLAFYNGALVYPDEIIKNYTGDIPLWATLANGDETPKEDNKNIPPVVDTKDEKAGDETPPPVESDKEGEDEKPATGEETDGVKETAKPQAEQTEAELLEEYNKLLDEAVDKGISLDDVDKKSLTEQIAELKVLLGKE